MIAWAEQWVLPYLTEPTLRPVLVALLGHVVVGVVPLLLGVWRTAHVGAVVALLGLLLGSAGLVVVELRRTRRVGVVTGTVGLSWASSVGLACVCQQTGIF